MMKGLYILTYTALFLMFLTFSACVENGKEAERQNVIIILSDDIGIGDIACYGAQLVNTPRIDKLALEGVMFNSAYANCSVCSPTRYSVLTGTYPCRSWCKEGALLQDDPLLIEIGQMTMASMFKEAGYKTAAIGKWHLGYGNDRPMDYNLPLTPGPLEVGFDYHFGVPSNHNDEIRAYVENHDLVGRIPGLPFVMAQDGQRVQGIDQERVDDEVDSTLTAKALGFIRENKENPFFLYFTPCAAHTHITPQRRFRGTSAAGQYGDYIQELDFHVGEILDLLDELHLAKNTLVFFLSDNGGQLSDYKNAGQGLKLANEEGDVGLKAKTAKGDAYKMGHRMNLSLRGAKGTSWEGGFRIPFILRWPGRITANTLSNEVVNTADLMATCAEVLGVSLPADAGGDSFSFLPALMDDPGKGQNPGRRTSSILQAANGTLSLRIDEWKLIQFSRGDPGSDRKDELYNLEQDPREKNNLAAKHPERLKSMNESLEGLLKKGNSR